MVDDAYAEWYEQEYQYNSIIPIVASVESVVSLTSSA
jgi:hypothetical protein